MIRVAFKALAQRRLRTALTVLAIVVGVGMVTAALVLGDSMKKGADSLSSGSYRGTDAVVSARTPFTVSSQQAGASPTIAADVLQRVRAVPEVGAAVGDITDQQVKLAGKDGEPVGDGPYFGVGYDAGAEGAGGLTPFHLRQGRFARGADEVVVDAGTAEKQGWKVGDPVRVSARGPARTMRITGIARFGDVDSLGTATSAVMGLGAAQSLLDKQGRFDNVLVSAAPGVSATELRQALDRELGSSARVQSAAASDRFGLDELSQVVKWIKVILLVFGGVAILVGAFTIANTMSITLAQRSRELALLRALGATRRQIMRLVIAEASVIGAIGSALGIVAGLFIAKGLNSVLAAASLELPQAGTVFGASTVVVALIVGLGVTVLAALGPATRSTRVSPVTAMRDGADIPPSRFGRRSVPIAVGMLGLSAVLLAFAAFAPGIDAGGRGALIGPGVLLLFLGVALVSPRLARPLASLIGRPLARIGGSAGSLARRNAMRDPGRTAATASALMIGLSLVVFVSVIGQGIRQSTTGALEKQVHAQYVVGSTDGWTEVDPAAAAAARKAPGVRTVSELTQDQARSFGKAAGVNGVDPRTIDSLYGFDVTEGRKPSPRSLAGNGALVEKGYADEHGLKVGSAFTVTSAKGDRLKLRVTGIGDPPRFDPLSLGEVTIAQSTFNQSFANRRDRLAFVSTGGTSAAHQRDIEKALAAFPTVQVQSAAEFADAQMSWVDDALGILYVLLALSVIVSLFGIVNTLVLSVFERRRELGMLRAVGMTRRQVRRMVRHESVITALIGATLGVGVGLALAGLVTSAFSDQGLAFSVPVGSLVAFTVVAGMAGVLAAVLPARRAARLEPLAALAYE
jgi:putative ABC transport system permease protein